MTSSNVTGSSTLPGTRYGELNQDHVEVHELLTPHEQSSKKLPACSLILVMDGHGLMGEKCAKKAAAAVAKSMMSSVLRKQALASLPDVTVQALFEEAFAMGHAASLELYRDPPKTYNYPKGSPAEDKYTLTYVDRQPMYHSRRLGGERLLEFGTTCTAVVVQGHAVAVGSVGDSGAILGRLQPPGQYLAEQLTTRHWGHNEDERTRVLQLHSDVVSFLGEDGYLSIEAGPWRGYQLSMTRALGHKMLAQYGVIAVPSVQRFTLTHEHFCLVVASDGVWDVIEEEAVVGMVARYAAEGLSAARIAHRLVKEAVHTSMEATGGDADNTSCVVLLL